MKDMGRTILTATLVAGTLDILAAAGLTLFYGKRGVDDMLRGVASGPLPQAPGWGASGAAIGLLVHFLLMAVMVLVYVRAAVRWPALNARPIAAGVGYGVVTFIVMNLIVVPLRFGAWPSAVSFGTQLFFHIVLVGLPIALITARRSGASIDANHSQ